MSRRRSTKLNLRDVSVDDVGELLGFGARRVQQLVKEKVLPEPARGGRYDAIACVRAWVEYEKQGRVADATMAQAQLDYWTARAEKERLEADELAGELLRLADVRDGIARVMASLAAALDGVAGRIAQKVVPRAGKDRAAVRDLLFREHRELRQRMSDGLLALAPEEPDR